MLEDALAQSIGDAYDGSRYVSPASLAGDEVADQLRGRDCGGIDASTTSQQAHWFGDRPG